ncbi:MAG: hypothetical protein WA867_24460 [Candidatus Acidiferrales bacterium]
MLLLAGAILSGLFGFSGIVMAAAASAKLLACLFLIAFLLPMIPPMPPTPKAPEPVWLRMSRKHAHSEARRSRSCPALDPHPNS